MSEPKGLLDMYVLVNDQKVFFRTSDSPKNEPTKLKFSTDFPLKEGANTVMVVARQTQDFASRKVLIIRRRPAAVAQALARGPGGRNRPAVAVAGPAGLSARARPGALPGGW